MKTTTIKNAATKMNKTSATIATQGMAGHQAHNKFLKGDIVVGSDGTVLKLLSHTNNKCEGKVRVLEVGSLLEVRTGWIINGFDFGGLVSFDFSSK